MACEARGRDYSWLIGDTLSCDKAQADLEAGWFYVDFVVELPYSFPCLTYFIVRNIANILRTSNPILIVFGPGINTASFGSDGL